MRRAFITMTHRRCGAVAVALAFAGLTHFAHALDLSTAYDAALSQDANIRYARAANESGRERLPQARSQWSPNVSFSASRNKNKLKSLTPNFFGVGQEGQADYFSDSRTLTLRQALINRGKIVDMEQAAFQVADADATLERETQVLAVRVGEAYFGALLAQDQLSLLLAQQTMTLAQFDAAQKTFAAGSGTRTDVDEMQARLDMNTAQLLEARQNVDYAKEQLVVLINQPVDQLAGLDARRLELLAPNPATLAQWQVLANDGSPEVKALEARKEAARKQVQKSQAGHMPTLDFIAQWSISDSENVTRLDSSYNTRSVGVQLSVPLYAGGYVDSLVRQSVAEQVRAEEALEATRRDLRLRVHKEFRGLTEGILRVKALEQAVRSADQVVISTRKSSQAGVRTLLDLIKAEAQRVESLRDLAQARYLYLLSGLRLRVLAGLAGRSSIDEINACLSK
jgi:outer membrane protein/protease secretion system outer membrane protein